MTAPDPLRLLNSRQVRELLAIGERTLRDAYQRGDLRPVRIGRLVRFRACDVERFVAERLARRGTAS